MIAIIFAVLWSTGGAYAYIPSSHFVFSKVAEKHGQGTYLIEQDVDFSYGPERLTVRESWTVVDGGEMRLQVRSDFVNIIKVYKRGRVYWVDQGGNERSQEFPLDFFMPALFTRNSTELKKLFIRWAILPQEVLKEKRTPKDIKDIKYEKEKFVRLGRTSGAIAYAYGQPSPIEGHLLPGLWVEQDVFTIRKIRTPSGAEFTGDQFAAFSKNLYLPKSQTIQFNGHIANVRLMKVQSVALTNEQKRALDPTSLRSQKSASTFPQAGLGQIIETFYTRMR